MTKNSKDVKHLKCCTRSSTYKPNLIRARPFKWIDFPVFVGIWTVLFWFIICPIVWSKVHTHSKTQEWSDLWPYLFWNLAFVVFGVILGILVAIWIYSNKLKNNANKYNQIFLNPEYGDEKETICIECMTFHPPGGAKCPCTLSSKNTCETCGNTKESFSVCCQKAKDLEKRILPGPEYKVVLRKQQPENLDVNKKEKTSEMKRNSLRSVKSRHSSSSSTIVISPHDVGTKDLINKNNDKLLKNSATGDLKFKEDSNAVNENKARSNVKNKRPLNLQPVDCDLANRHSNIEFFGEKLPLKGIKTVTQEVVNVHHTKTSSEPDNKDVVEEKSGSIGSLDSMDKKRFDQYLHLVEINTPFSPEETIVKEDPVDQPPLSPREIFFYDLIQAAEKSDSANSPDSTNFGFYSKYEKKRPVSHILLTSDVNLDNEPETSKAEVLKRHTLANFQALDMKRANSQPREDLESPRILALAESIKLHASVANDDKRPLIVRCDSQDNKEKQTTVKILRTVKKSSTEADSLAHPAFERMSYQTSPMAEVTSAHDINSPEKQSVSKYFIANLRGPPKPVRQSSSIDHSSSGSSHRASDPIVEDISGSVKNDNDDVFSN